MTTVCISPVCIFKIILIFFACHKHSRRLIWQQILIDNCTVRQYYVLFSYLYVIHTAEASSCCCWFLPSLPSSFCQFFSHSLISFVTSLTLLSLGIATVSVPDLCFFPFLYLLVELVPVPIFFSSAAIIVTVPVFQWSPVIIVPIPDFPSFPSINAFCSGPPLIFCCYCSCSGRPLVILQLSQPQRLSQNLLFLILPTPCLPRVLSSIPSLSEHSTFSFMLLPSSSTSAILRPPFNPIFQLE